MTLNSADYRRLSDKAGEYVDNITYDEYLEWLDDWLQNDDVAYALWRQWACERAYQRLIESAMERQIDEEGR